MIALIWRALRENARWAAIALALASFGYVIALSGRPHDGMLSGEAQQVTTLLPAWGLALGLLQMLPADAPRPLGAAAAPSAVAPAHLRRDGSGRMLLVIVPCSCPSSAPGCGRCCPAASPRPSTRARRWRRCDIAGGLTYTPALLIAVRRARWCAAACGARMGDPVLVRRGRPPVACGSVRRRLAAAVAYGAAGASFVRAARTALLASRTARCSA